MDPFEPDFLTDPVTFKPNFLDQETATKFFEQLMTELAWDQREDAPRKEYWTNTLNKPYTYGRGRGERTYYSQKSHPVVDFVREKLVEELKCAPLEGCFLNRYDNERNGLGWHADDDPNIDHTRPIAVITLGQARELQYRSREDAQKYSKGVWIGIKAIEVTHGSLLIMHAGMQQTHLHRIPKSAFKAKPRISLTYRGLIHAST